MFKLHRKSSAVTEAIEYVIAGEELAIGILVKYSEGKSTPEPSPPEHFL